MADTRKAILSQLDTAPGYKRVAMVIEKAILDGTLTAGDLPAIESDLAAARSAGDAPEAEAWVTRHIADFRRGYVVGGKALSAPIPFRADLAA